MPSLPPLTLHILLIAACAIVIVCVAAAAAALCAGGFKTWCTAKQKIDAGALPLLLEARDTEASADSTFAPSSGGDSTVLGDFFSAVEASTVAVEAAESACAGLLSQTPRLKMIEKKNQKIKLKVSPLPSGAQ